MPGPLRISFPLLKAIVFRTQSLYMTPLNPRGEPFSLCHTSLNPRGEPFSLCQTSLNPRGEPFSLCQTSLNPRGELFSLFTFQWILLFRMSITDSKRMDCLFPGNRLFPFVRYKLITVTFPFLFYFNVSITNSSILLLNICPEVMFSTHRSPFSPCSPCSPYAPRS
jgi:hypothetical protein